MLNLYDSDQPLVGDPLRVHLLERVLQLAAEKKIKILDAGCKSGQLWLPLLNHPNIEIWGIDLDDEAIKQAKEKFGPDKAITLNIYNLTQHFAENEFDIVVSTQTLMFLKHLPKALFEINSVLKPGGYFLFTIGWTKYRPNNQLKRQIRSFFDERYYVHRYDEHELVRALQETHFAVQEIRFGAIDLLKEIHNKIINVQHQNKFLKQWKLLEDSLIDDQDFKDRGKKFCLGIYFEATK